MTSKDSVYKYLFTSERLGFRVLQEEDLDVMHGIFSDPVVMEFFPSVMTRDQTIEFIKRMQRLYEERAHCFFGVEVLSAEELIGFIGLGYSDFESDFTPVVDIGWRLAQKAWGKGYATEGAERCLLYAKEKLGMKKMHAIAPKINIKSIKVMQKTGLEYVKDFQHPKIPKTSPLKTCVLYESLI